MGLEEENALEIAKRFPDAKLILSGGNVKTEFTEAAVMKEWLVEQVENLEENNG